MGWRLGQGIGPRITLKQRKEQDAQAYEASTGAKYSGSTLNINDDDDEATKHTYAPRDTPVLAVKRKVDTHGLGYVPGLSLSESLGNNAAADSKGPKLAGVGIDFSFLPSINPLIGGFGLGALNDADEDDLDVYDSVQQHSRRRLAYDHLSGEGDDTIVIGGRSDKQKASIPVCIFVLDLVRCSPTSPRGPHLQYNTSETDALLSLDLCFRMNLWRKIDGNSPPFPKGFH